MLSFLGMSFTHEPVVKGQELHLFTLHSPTAPKRVKPVIDLLLILIQSPTLKS